jgi:ligand-binding sensor protein
LLRNLGSIVKGQSYICAVAHQNAANQAQKTREPAIIECDAGLVKAVVPICVDDEFLGVAGGCGLLQKGSEVDSFLINKTTDIGVGEIENLSDDIATISIAKIESVIKYIEQELEWILLPKLVRFWNSGLSALSETDL